MEEPNKSVNLTEAIEFEYEIPNPNESIVDFKRRVEEQIELLRTGIQNGNVKDPKKAENFVKKAERFLSIPYFSDNESQDKRVYDLKKRIGTIIIANSNISTIITDWLCLKGDSKVNIANEGKSKKEQGSFSFREEMQLFYSENCDFLTSQLYYEVARLWNIILLNFLNDRDNMSRLGIKNSCKLVDLKKALEENRDKLQDIDDEIYNLIMKTPVFYSKVGSSWRVRYLKEQLGIVIEALNIIVNWINEQSDIAQRENEKWSNLDTDADFDEVLAHFDSFISEMTATKQEYDDEYNRYLFGLYLLEADYFAPLYK